MKKYLCHVGEWKMNQLKGKSYEEIQRLYYQEYRRDKDFLPMHSEAEAQRYKRSGIILNLKMLKDLRLKSHLKLLKKMRN